MKASLPKSHNSASSPFARSRTCRVASTSPTTAQAMSRAAKRLNTSATCAGFTLSMKP